MSSKSALTGNSNQTFSFEQMPRMTGNHQKLIELRISNNSDLFNILSPYKDIHFNGQSIFDVLGFPNDLLERLNQLITQKFI